MRTSARGLAALALVGAALRSAPSRADEVQGTRYELTERAHVVDVTLDRGHATLVVTRTVDNPGPRSDQAVFRIGVPQGAVATRLRSAGARPDGARIWFEADLLEAEEAARRYQELTGIGGFSPKDPALLSWRSQSELALQVFPVPARSSKVVEYTLRVPLEYADGRYTLALRPLGTDELPATLRVAPVHPEDRVDVNGVAVTASTTFRADRDLTIRLAPRGVAKVEGALASFACGPDRHLVHARVAAAPRLSEAPAAAAVVVLLDTSRSMENALMPALGALRAYLAELPAATSVEIMTFDRTVRSPFGGPLPARDALSRLYTFAPTTHNGSQLDDALAKADAKLAHSLRPTRRILVLTDLLTRSAVTPELVASRTIASRALVHVATVSEGEPSLARDDEAPWAALPRKTGGLLWRAQSRDVLAPDGRRVFAEWVRPMRIEKLAIDGLPEELSSPPEELREGEGFEALGVAPNEVARLSVTGELWSTPVRLTLTPSADETKRWAALVFGTSVLDELSEEEQMKLAMHGRAVSPVTSYLAIEPGVRPSTEGLEWGAGEGGGGLASIGLGNVGTLCRGAFGSTFDHRAFLEAELDAVLTACGVVSGTVGVTIESTQAEIVDVPWVRLWPGPEPKIEACIVEQLWGLSLPPAFVEGHATWHLRASR